MSTPGIVGFTTVVKCETHQIVYIDNRDVLDKVPLYLFGLPVIVYLVTRCLSYRDEEVIHELVRETLPEKKTFIDNLKETVKRFIDGF